MAVIVTGSQRSGTSLMMRCMRDLMGEDNIIGTKFPNEHRGVKRTVFDTDETYAFKQYGFEQDRDSREKDLEISRDMNPNGFWETPFVMRGIYYSPAFEDVLSDILSRGSSVALKLVSQALANSDPRFVDKVVLMARDPLSVAISQRRLRRELFVKDPNGNSVNLWDHIGEVVTPNLFMSVSISLARWMRKHPYIPVHVVDYSELMRNPEEVMQSLAEFLGVSDDSSVTKAASNVDASLNRSGNDKDRSKDGEEYAEAFKVFDFLREQDWDSIISFSKDALTRYSKANHEWKCVRNGMNANIAICEACMSDTLYVEGFKRVANDLGIPWKERPCAFECAYDLDRNAYVTIEDSIKNNHWLED
jgi:hypothetical protein